MINYWPLTQMPAICQFEPSSRCGRRSAEINLQMASSTQRPAAGSANIQDSIRVESEHITQLAAQKEELLAKVIHWHCRRDDFRSQGVSHPSLTSQTPQVGTLKKELLEWRTKLDGQVTSFRGVRGIMVCITICMPLSMGQLATGAMRYRCHAAMRWSSMHHRVNRLNTCSNYTPSSFIS